MIDVHCHLNFHAFEKDYDQVIRRSLNDGVTKIINVGTKIDSSHKAIELAQKYHNLYAIIGVHPHHADKVFIPRHPGGSPSADGRPIGSHGDSISASWRIQNDIGWVEYLEQLAKDKKVVGIGECGMDYYSYKLNDVVDPKLQKEVFIKQIELAYKLKLPLQIHNRHAGKDIIDILLNHKSYLLNPSGMFHCMSGDIDLLKKVLDLGFYIGLDGNITYKGLAPGEITDLKDLVTYTPLNKIVTETDSPFLTPVPHRGSRNIPSYVILVARKIAEIKGISFAKVEDQTIKNANYLFKLNAKR